MERWRAFYDVVLLDSPPVLPLADAGILSGLTDGIILVVRQETGRTALADCLDRLTAAGGRIMGTVFVASTRSRTSYAYAYDRKEET
jgi:receptor protein-tyrosine kinase